MSPTMKCAAVALAALVLISAGLTPARAQSPERVYRLAHLGLTADGEERFRSLSLPLLATLGFVEGRNLVVDGRVGAVDVLAGLMPELLAARPDVIIANGGAILRIASAATRTVPIVSTTANPVEMGLAASFARPGGNVTGGVILSVELDAKRLDLLREAVPGRRRFAVLFPSTSPSRPASEREMRSVAASTGIDLLDFFIVAAPADYQAAFAAMRAAGAQALVITGGGELLRDATVLAALALEARLPTICMWAEMARSGCLLGYGPDRLEQRRRNTDQIARILRGAAPADIPIELPTRFEFAVNLKVARALGVELPPAILARADEVIE